MMITHDGSIDVAVGKWRLSKTWTNKPVAWSILVEKLSKTVYTAEKHAEYLALPKAKQDEIKDIGGFVGGYLLNGRRKSGSVTHRQLITLDMDFTTTSDAWGDFTLLYDCAACVYSTHKHTPDKPRLRFVIPLDREVQPDEYIAISRRIAGIMDIEQFDDTTYQPERLMYWPSTSADAEFVFHYQDGPFLSADAVLRSYRNWKDSSSWPVSVRHKDAVHRAAVKQGDPLEKPGLIGAWCRTYSITEVLEKFLPDVYEETDYNDRFTYNLGSTAGGLVVYDDKFAFSHHGTDPVSGKLCNAFDLVRLHLFGLQDEDAKDGTLPHHLPSFKAMQAFCSDDPAVRKLLVNERLQGAKDAFSGIASVEVDQVQTTSFQDVINSEGTEYDTADDTWKEKLDVDRKGNICSTIDNIVLVLEHDPSLKGAFMWDAFEQRPIAVRDLPWRKTVGEGEQYFRDTDDANLAHYLERVYDISGTKIEKAMGVIFERHRKHPVREYLGGLKWDGVKRLETLLVEYLGAEDTDYVRAVTRKTLAGAVARVMRPGCKFDTMLVFVGKQGTRKSTLIDKLGGRWFSDSFTTLQGNQAFEQLQGSWLIEVAELSAFKRSEVETVKHFISKRKDKYRAAYGHHVVDYARQCIFFGSTNKIDFLKDATGNRRFWPVTTNRERREKDPADITRLEVDQLWAEAVEVYKSGEKLYISDDDPLWADVEAMQKAHTEVDPRTDTVIKYLDTLLPESWKDMGVWDRRQFIQGALPELEGVNERDKVTIGELWSECFGKQIGDMTRYNTGDIYDLMDKLPGWERASSKFRGGYGLQRGFVRVPIGANKS